MAYSEKVIDHYENPRNVGSFGKEESGVATGMVGAPACGDVMKLQIKVPRTLHRGRRSDLRCALDWSSSLVNEWVKGKTVDQRGLRNTADRRGAALPPGGSISSSRGRHQARCRLQEEYAANRSERSAD